MNTFMDTNKLTKYILFVIFAFSLSACISDKNNPQYYKIVDIELQKIDLEGLSMNDCLSDSLVSRYLLIVVLKDTLHQDYFVGNKPYFAGNYNPIKSILIHDTKSRNITQDFSGNRCFRQIEYKNLGVSSKNLVYKKIIIFPTDHLEHIPDSINNLWINAAACTKFADGKRCYCTLLTYKGKDAPKKILMKLENQEEIEGKVTNSPIPLKFEALTVMGSWATLH